MASIYGMQAAMDVDGKMEGVRRIYFRCYC